MSSRFAKQNWMCVTNESTEERRWVSVQVSRIRCSSVTHHDDEAGMGFRQQVFFFLFVCYNGKIRLGLFTRAPNHNKLFLKLVCLQPEDSESGSLQGKKMKNSQACLGSPHPTSTLQLEPEMEVIRRIEVEWRDAEMKGWGRDVGKVEEMRKGWGMWGGKKERRKGERDEGKDEGMRKGWRRGKREGSGSIMRVQGHVGMQTSRGRAKGEGGSRNGETKVRRQVRWV